MSSSIARTHLATTAGRGRGVYLAEYLDEVAGRSVAYRFCNLRNRQVGFQEKVYCSL